MLFPSVEAMDQLGKVMLASFELRSGRESLVARKLDLVQLLIIDAQDASSALVTMQT